VPVYAVFLACLHYITKRRSYQVAAFLMHCESAMSFRLYWLRLISKHDVLLQSIIRQISAVTGGIDDCMKKVFPAGKETLLRGWQRLCITARKLIGAYGRLPGMELMDEEKNTCLIVSGFFHFPMRAGP